MKLVALAAALASLVGCAQRIRIESDPPGAEVWVGSKFKGETPVDAKITPPHSYSGPLEVTVKKPGHLPKLLRFEKSFVISAGGWQWSPTAAYVKLDAFEPAPSPSPKPGE